MKRHYFIKKILTSFGGVLIGSKISFLIDNKLYHLKKNMQTIDPKNFQKQIDNKKIDLFTLNNNQGLKTQITNYGARVVSLFVKDKDGNFDDIVLGYDTIDDYLTKPELFLGATIGRYGNRISKSKFSINNKEYNLSKNEGENQLHGGNKGFHNVVWNANQISDSELELTYLSKDKEEGFPGNLNVKVIYKLTDENELKISYFATTDKETHVNLTHHSYFNLTGKLNSSIENHELQINATHYTPVNQEMIPTGKIELVLDSPFDFKFSKTIGKDLNNNHQQLKIAAGFDHNFVLNDNKIKKATTVKELVSGRIMEVFTNEPGIQFYSGNHINNVVGKNNIVYQNRNAFCLETQHFPDSPNQSNFPSTLLKPGEEYYSFCIYKFSVNN